MRHMPVALVILIYLPAALFGGWAFADAQAATFLLLLTVFVVSYYLVYPRAATILHSASLRRVCRSIGQLVPWAALAWLAAAVYLAAIGIAAYTTDLTPLAAALQGASVTDIAHARAQFLANREGAEALLRYAAVILGRSVLPFVVTYLYWTGHPARHLALAMLLGAHAVSLEKAAPIFVLLPMVLLRAVQGNLRACSGWLLLMCACIVLWSLLAFGTLHDPRRSVGAPVPPAASVSTAPSGSASAPDPVRTSSALDPETEALLAEDERYGNPNRHFMPNLMPGWLSMARLQYASDTVKQVVWLLNRMIWIPYVTAYDWLGFQDKIMQGQITHGRQIGIVSRLLGERRLPLEQTIYRYQFGASPGGAGASNTVFFVDAKLAFGWPGVLAWCLLFPLLAAAVFESSNPVVQVASATSFFTAAMSPLTATLLSGGLFFFIVVALFTGHGRAEPAEGSP